MNLDLKNPYVLAGLRARFGLFLRVSCRPYRHNALFLKAFIAILQLISLNSNTYAESRLEKVSSIYRLRGPDSPPLSVRAELTPKNTSGSCGGKRTADLVLSFRNQEQAAAWIDFESFTSQGPCEVKAYPLANAFEFRLSYLTGSNEELQWLSYEIEGAWLVDHWKVNPTLKTSKSKVKKSVTQKVSSKGLQQSLKSNPLLDFNEKVVDLYEDQESWKKILGQAGQALSFDTPELDRFRVSVNTYDASYAKLPLEKRPLKLPLLALPLLDASLEFAEEKLEIPIFEKRDLDSEGLKGASERDVALALEGLNYLRKLYLDKQWLKARESIHILEKGSSRKLVPQDSAKWWALKGLVYQRLGVDLKDDEFAKQGLDYWREGLRRVAGRGAPEQAYADYMVLESLRLMFLRSLFYPAAALLAWSERFRWSPSTEERLAFWRAEVHYRLGLMDESRELFEKFLELRKDVPLSASFDRRLVPLAFFRIGDSRMRQNDYKRAIQDYSKAFSQIPTQEKISFEAAWFPMEIRYYPQVLFHRAEASLREGNVANALSDLRAFVNFALNHPNLGLIMYRIGDLLELVGGPVEKVEGAWKECVFRAGDDIGGKLCKARQAVRDIRDDNKNAWPRLVAEVEDLLTAKNIKVFEPSFEEDLKLYVHVLLIHTFLSRKDPFQAYMQSRKVRGLESTSDLRDWIDEYRVSAVAGYMAKKRDEGKFKEVLSLYAEAKNPPGLKANRPEILWNLAKTYQALGAWKNALEFVESGMTANSQNRPHDSRPYLPSQEDWKILKIENQIKLISSQEVSPADVAKNLEQLKDKKSQTYWALSLEFARVSKNPKREIASFENLEKLRGLSWIEYERYLGLLREQKSFKTWKSKMEAVLSPWASRDLKTAQDAPPLKLLFELFEARELAKDLLKAETLINKLLQEASSDSIITREQLLYRRGILLKNLGRKTDARQSFENAKTLAPESVWGKLSNTELQALDL